MPHLLHGITQYLLLPRHSDERTDKLGFHVEHLFDFREIAEQFVGEDMRRGRSGVLLDH